MSETHIDAVTYEAPELVELGSLAELTLGCDKRYGDADGNTFHGQSIVCVSR